MARAQGHAVAVAAWLRWLHGVAAWLRWLALFVKTVVSSMLLTSLLLRNEAAEASSETTNCRTRVAEAVWCLCGGASGRVGGAQRVGASIIYNLPLEEGLRGLRQ